MAASSKQLDQLLALIADHIDPDHCHAVDQRYRAALTCEPVDHPPLVALSDYTTQWQLPAPWDQFEQYSYSHAFHDPVAMMQNMLLDRLTLLPRA